MHVLDHLGQVVPSWLVEPCGLQVVEPLTQVIGYVLDLVCSEQAGLRRDPVVKWSDVCLAQ